MRETANRLLKLRAYVNLVSEIQEKVDILMVDDWQANLEAFTAILDSDDFNIVQARSGEEALAAICPAAGIRREFAVILLDDLIAQGKSLRR